MDAAQHELRRSQKIQDFSGGVTRERSFVVKSQHHSQMARDEYQNKRRSQIIGQPKGKPSIEIYRPPNVRVDNMPLNVHAKEFTMKSFGGPTLQQSRSSGNMLRHGQSLLMTPLQQSISTGCMVPGPARVQFQLPIKQPSVKKKSGVGMVVGTGVKRSKSLSAADSACLAAKLKNMTVLDTEQELGPFPPEFSQELKRAIEDPNRLGSRNLMEIVRRLLERIIEGKRFSGPGAKICISIIEKERTETFLESLINICQQWFQERDNILRKPAEGGTRFTAFMSFLTEMCSHLKRRQVQQPVPGASERPPALVLLNLLVRCCQACIEIRNGHPAEIECLYFVLTTIGRDLQVELPEQLDRLLSDVRDGFLSGLYSPNARKTLLQLIELKASNWQLSGPTVLYYYPNTHINIK